MTLDRDRPTVLAVPLGSPCSTIFVSAAARAAPPGACYVITALKVRTAGRLMRQVRSIRDRHADADELTFAAVSQARLLVVTEVIDALSASDARISAIVVDGQAGGDHPLAHEGTRWAHTARLTARLLQGSIARGELASAIIDDVSTPADDAFDETVRELTNARRGATVLVSALSAERRASDGLQLADLVAGAIAYQRRSTARDTDDRDPADPADPQGQAAARLADSFGVADFRTDRLTNRVDLVAFRDIAAAVRAPLDLAFVRRRR
jgi:hypothetical protein